MELLENVEQDASTSSWTTTSPTTTARAWLADKYPQHLQLDGRQASRRPRMQPDGQPPNFTADLDLSESVDVDDQSAIEETLVPAARRKLAQSRLKMLSTLVLMGINRIVITGGKIRATMGFHINTRDTAHAGAAQSASTSRRARPAASASGRGRRRRRCRSRTSARRRRTRTPS